MALLAIVLAAAALLLLKGSAQAGKQTNAVPSYAQAPASTGTATTVVPGMPNCCLPAPTTEATQQGTQGTAQPTALPTGAPAKVAPTPHPAFGLAWFHKPPSDGTTPQQLAANLSYIHLTGTADIPYRNRLRAAGYTGPIYTYTAADGVEGPGPYRNSSDACQVGYTGFDNNLAFNTDDFCKYIHPHESWFLHNGKGDRLVEDYFGTGHYAYLMNPADPGWQAYAQDRLLFIKNNWGYDGIWLDNVDLTLDRAYNEAQNGDGAVQEFAGDGEWRAAMAQYLAGIRAKLGNYPLWANIVGGDITADSWDVYAPYLDGAMDESFGVRWLDNWETPEQWEGQLERSEKWLAAGKGLIAVGQGTQSDQQRQLFTLASYLLIAQPNQAFFRYTNAASYYDALWLYPNYDAARALGTPLGPRQQTSPGVWTRQFTGGSVEVGVGGHVGKITK